MEHLDTFKHKGMRAELVRIIRDKGISDQAVLNAIGKIPRHLFLDTMFDRHAYQNKPFSIGEGQTISQPYTVAFQTELLQIKKGDKVLEVGTGSGYQASVLAELGAEVYTVEVLPLLHNRAKEILTKLQYTAHTFLTDGSKGLPDFAPFDKIIVTAATPRLPISLGTQLREGGVLVAPIGGRDVQKMVRLTKRPNGEFKHEEFGHFVFVPLVGEEGWG